MKLSFSSDEIEEAQDFYVALESIEAIGDGAFQLIFDGVAKTNFEGYAQTSITESYEKVKPHLFLITIRDSFFVTFVEFLQSRRYMNRWFLLRVTQIQTDLPTTMFVEDNIEPVAISRFIKSIERIGYYFGVARALTNFFSWQNFQIVNPANITAELQSISPSADTIHKLNVYNVGQGSLTAVTNEQNVPLFYYDLGGAWWLHRATYPVTLNLCFTRAKTVILSHWDLDHVETARRLLYQNPAQLRGLTWIAPEQVVTPYYYTLAARLARLGTLILWGAGYQTAINFWAGQLIKCSGPDKNHSGLALVVNSPNNSIQRVLHPGDAAYMYIQGVNQMNLDGLVATHHGANFDIGNTPLPGTTNGKIAYSHANRYGHPTPGATTAHRGAGWINRRDTTSGHISFTTNLLTNNVVCGGANCGLSIVQNF